MRRRNSRSVIWKGITQNGMLRGRRRMKKNEEQSGAKRATIRKRRLFFRFHIITKVTQQQENVLDNQN